MLIGIEGTGSQDWQFTESRRSFVLRTVCQSRLLNKYYFIGPDLSGDDGWKIVNGAWTLIMRTLRDNPSEPIYLVGYSRGAAYCMLLCQNLLTNRMGYTAPVAGLALFDAVARQYFDIPDKVPSNVKQCFHAYRDPRTGSRYFFQNVGLNPNNPLTTHFEKRMFYASHGGMGGIPWDSLVGETESDYWGDKVIGSDDRNKTTVPHDSVITETEDRAGSILAGQWMWGNMARLGMVPSRNGYMQLAPPIDLPPVGQPLPIR